MPAPARMRIGGMSSGLSPSASAAAMPACAQTLDAPSPSGAPETTVTGSGASLSAVNRPARPAADNDHAALSLDALALRRWQTGLLRMSSVTAYRSPLATA